MCCGGVSWCVVLAVGPAPPAGSSRHGLAGGMGAGGDVHLSVERRRSAVPFAALPRNGEGGGVSQADSRWAGAQLASLAGTLSNECFQQGWQAVACARNEAIGAPAGSWCRHTQQWAGRCRGQGCAYRRCAPSAPPNRQAQQWALRGGGAAWLVWGVAGYPPRTRPAQQWVCREQGGRQSVVGWCDCVKRIAAFKCRPFVCA